MRNIKNIQKRKKLEKDRTIRERKFVNRLEQEHKDCPRCGYEFTIFSVVPLEGTSKYKWMRFCPRCELIWPP